MRRGHGILAALVALALTACALKDEAPQAAAEAPASVMVQTKSAVEGSGEEGAFGDDAPVLADEVLEEQAEPPPPPPEPAFALDTDSDYDYAVDDVTGVDGMNGSARGEPAPAAPMPGAIDGTRDREAATNAALRAFDQAPSGANQAVTGLGLSGAGLGGGGQGFGRVHGMGRVDTGGGKGYGRGPGGDGKKKRKVAEESARMRGDVSGKLELLEPVAAPKPAPRRERSVSDRRASRTIALGEVAELEDEEEKELSEKKADKAADRFAAVGQKSRPRKPMDDGESTLRWQNERTRDPSGGEFETMLAPVDASELDGRFEPAEYAARFAPPSRTIPRMCYFENTYLGGNAAYTERLRRLDDALPGGRQPYRAAALPRQPFDAPDDAGLALTATLDRPYVDQPQRVFLQVGLQGSKRFGWRRPPLDIALVVDSTATDGETLVEAITALSRRLGPQDRLGVVLTATQPIVLGDLAPLRDRVVLARAIEALGPVPPSPPGALSVAMGRAGAMLQTAAGDSARIPGTQTVLVLTGGAPDGRIARAREAAHALTVQGAVTSVIQLGGDHQGWWQVANAGHGNYHLTTADALDGAVDDELGSIARVIARLLRVNVKLADGVEAIRVVGSRVLGQQEVKQVKAREEATDRNLSKTMGVKADRGDDDDGIQTVIPYFYGGDSHVILIELWVTRPGAVAEVTLKYKDMVALENATARVAAEVDRMPRPLTPAERRVAFNVVGFQLAEGLAGVAQHAERGRAAAALNVLEELDTLALGRDRQMLDAFEALVRQRGADRTVADALRMARDRRIGHSP